jgi:hypothetical protein
MIRIPSYLNGNFSSKFLKLKFTINWNMPATALSTVGATNLASALKGKSS